MRLSLFLMSEKGLTVLRVIIDHGLDHLVELVVLGRDKDVQEDYADEISALAQGRGIPIVERNAGYELKTPYAIAISWRWLIPVQKSDTKLITFHDSLLPKYRGFAPLVNQLINGEELIGVTAIFATNDYDTGDIIDQEAIQITYPIKIQQAISLVSVSYGRLMIRLLHKLMKGERLAGKAQSEEDATYSLWRDVHDYRIDWTKDATYIKRFIDSVGFPYAGAQSAISGETIRIMEAEVVEDVVIVNRNPGKVLFVRDYFPILVCGKGLLRITSAVYDKDSSPILPLAKFRTRFQ